MPVITADVGGMAEYVHHEVNGLHFEHRNINSLAEQMQRCVHNPGFVAKLGERGYLFSDSGDIPSIQDHVSDIRRIYFDLNRYRNNSTVQSLNGPWRITFDTNPDTCNLHCVMCEEHSFIAEQTALTRVKKPHRIMPIELIERVVREASKNGLKEIIPSTTGEPLLYRDFDRIIELCTQNDLKLNLTTNGTFPGRGAESWAEVIVPIGSDVKISINGFTREVQEKIMVGSCLEAIDANIVSFLKIRDEFAGSGNNYCNVTLQLTFMEENLREIPAIVEKTIMLGIDRVKGHHVWIHNEQMKTQSLKRNMQAIERWNSTVQTVEEITEKRLRQNGEKLRLDNFFILENSVGKIKDMDICPFLGREAWINTEGRFSPCCAPDDLRKSLGDFGNLNNQSLYEIWTSMPYRALVKTYRNKAICMDCNMRKLAGVQ